MKPYKTLPIYLTIMVIDGKHYIQIDRKGTLTVINISDKKAKMLSDTYQLQIIKRI